LIPSKFAQNSTITLIKVFCASTGARFFVQMSYAEETVQLNLVN